MTPRQNVEKLSTFQTALWVFVGVGLVVSVVSLAAYAVLSPSATLLGICLGGGYVVAFWALFRFSGLWPSHATWRWFLASLFWGGGVAFALVMATGGAWMTLTDNLGWEEVSASFAGAWPEEIVKSFGVLLILYGSRCCNRPWHGFVTGGIVGLGFEVFENVMYGAVGGLYDPNSDIEGAINLWMLRTIGGPGLHVFLSAIAGFGIGMALYSYGWDKVQRLQALVTGVAWAFVLHFVWNVQWSSIAVHIVAMIVVAILLYTTAFVIWRWSRKQIREGQEAVVVGDPAGRFADLQRPAPNDPGTLSSRYMSRR